MRTLEYPCTGRCRRAPPEGRTVGILITRQPEYESDAEQAAVEALVAQLPDDWHIAHGVGWTTRDRSGRQVSGEADVIALSTDGICVAEVKGGRIERRGTQWLSISRTGQSHPIKDPARQALRSKKRLEKKVRELGIARNAVFCHAVIFPDCSADVAQLGMDLDGGVLVDGEDMPALGKGVVDLVHAKDARPIRPADVETLCRLLEPDWSLGGDIGIAIDRERAEAAELTEQQHRTLKGLLAQIRAVVEGGPGTGKSLLAMRFAAEQARDGRRVLYVCYNRPLAEHQQALAARAALPNLCISTFHELCETWATTAGIHPGPKPERGDREALSAWFTGLVDGVCENVAVGDSFDTIVIDEGQDFGQDWVDLLSVALTDPDRAGGLYLFLDPSQRIYDNGPLPDLPDAIHWPLGRQLRTSATLARSIAEFLGDPEPDVGIEGGYPLEIVEIDSLDDTPKALGALLHKLVRERGVAPHDIVVQTGVAAARSRLWGRRLANLTLAGRNPDSYHSPTDLAHDEVRVETIHRFKGLETPATILCELDPHTKTDLRTLMRIGLYRAQTYAAVVVTPEVVSALHRHRGLVA